MRRVWRNSDIGAPDPMDILFLLVPISVLLALGVMGVLAWAVWSGQFEELESEGQRIFMDDRTEPLPTVQNREA